MHQVAWRERIERNITFTPHASPRGAGIGALRSRGGGRPLAGPNPITAAVREQRDTIPALPCGRALRARANALEGEPS